MYSSLVPFVLASLAFPASVIPSHMIPLTTPGQVVATLHCRPMFYCCRRRALNSSVLYCDAVPCRVILWLIFYLNVFRRSEYRPLCAVAAALCWIHSLPIRRTVYTTRTVLNRFATSRRITFHRRTPSTYLGGRGGGVHVGTRHGSPLVAIRE